MRLPDNVGNGIENESMNGNDQMLTDENVGSNDLNTVLPRESWFQPGQDHWSLSFPVTGQITSFPADLNAGGLSQWTNASSISATAPEDVSFPLPAFRGNSPRIAHSPGPAPNEIDQIDRTASSLPSQTPAPSSTSSREDHAPDLYSCLDRASPVTKRLIQVYFSEIHPFWPILHAPTFDTCEASASHVLLGSMIMLASWLEGEQDHTMLAPLVFDAVTSTLLVCTLVRVPFELSEH